jgi:hypothetical protein
MCFGFAEARNRGDIALLEKQRQRDLCDRFVALECDLSRSRVLEQFAAREWTVRGKHEAESCGMQRALSSDRGTGGIPPVK